MAVYRDRAIYSSVKNVYMYAGLSQAEIEELGAPSDQPNLKVSRRDLAYALSQV